MIEQSVIQSRGFHNLKNASGQVTGFQFCISPRYYRGLYLSQFCFGNVMVDDVEYDKKDIMFTIQGIDYSLEEMKKEGHTWWPLDEVATLTFCKDGGLEQGYHTIVINLGFINNYIAPEREHPEFGVNFKGFEHSRKLLIV